MRSRVCFDAVHSDRLRLLIEYGMLTGLHYFGGYRGHLLVVPGHHTGAYPFVIMFGGSSASCPSLIARIPPFSGTCPNPSLVLAQIPPFSDTLLDPSPVLVRTLLRYSPRPFYGARPDSIIFRYSPGPFSGARPDFTLFWYSPGPFSGIRPDSTLLRYSSGAFSVFARTLLRYSPGAFSVLARTLLRYLPRTFFGTRPDSTIFRYLPEPFSGTCLDQIPNLSRHHDWVSFYLSPASCLDPIVHLNLFPSVRPVGIRFGRFSRFIESAEPTTNPYGFLVVKQAEN
uniref:Uncharacterized protein n=1 Tax=Vitis vinifera TaxID=29760 RepID=A5AZK0_VITVI|nr:hypothetical protein VITISV_012371 [Vitis vinifera]